MSGKEAESQLATPLNLDPEISKTLNLDSIDFEKSRERYHLQFELKGQMKQWRKQIVEKIKDKEYKNQL